METRQTRGGVAGLCALIAFVSDPASAEVFTSVVTVSQDSPYVAAGDWQVLSGTEWSVPPGQTVPALWVEHPDPFAGGGGAVFLGLSSGMNAGLWDSLYPGTPFNPSAAVSPWQFGIRFTPLAATAATGFAWYQAEAGNRFDADFAREHSPVVPLLDGSSQWPAAAFDPITIDGFSNQPVAFDQRTFFLASWLDSDWSFTPSSDDFYSWAQLRVSYSSTAASYELNVLESGMAQGGIIVGELVAVPEPALLPLVLAGSGGLGLARFVRATLQHAATGDYRLRCLT